MGKEQQLFQAIEDSKVEAVERLINDPSVDVNALSPFYQETPLRIAVRQENKSIPIITALLKAPNLDKNAPGNIRALTDMLIGIAANVDIAKQLINAGINTNAMDADGYIPLHCAINGKAQDIVAYLLTQQIDPNLKDKNGRTALHVATARDLDLVKQLLDKGFDVNAQDDAGLTPLHYAVHFIGGVNAVLPYLLGLDKINLKLTDAQGRTALHTAVQYGLLDDVEQLLAKDFDVNAQDNQGNTPLHLAAQLGRRGIVQRLLRVSKIDTGIKNANEQTALAVAKQDVLPHYAQDYENVIGLLQQRTPLNTTIDSLIGTVKEWSHPAPTRWYEKLFHWIRNFFSPVREMKDKVRTAFIEKLSKIKGNTSATPDQQYNALREAIDRFTLVQQFIEITRHNKNNQTVDSALGYLDAQNTLDFQFSGFGSHKGFEKETQRHEVLMKAIKKLKPA